jgi:putative spermidine/putrescine transport system permease protein/spermidine/putrescine transport system permease protein
MTLTKGAMLSLVAITGLVFLLLYGPLLVPIVSSFFTLDHGSILWDQPSLESYAALSRNETILEAVTNTLMVGAAAVVLALIMGMVMALHYCSGRSASREIMQFVIFLPFLMPPMVTGLSLLVFFREIDFDRSLVTVTIGHTVFILTLAYRMIVVRLQSLEPGIIEASYDLGATNWQTFRYILLPSLRGALIGAAVLCFALSFDETMITILVTGPDSTLPVLLWAMTRLGFPPDVNALVTLVLALTTLMCLVAAWQLLPSEMIVEEAN